MEQAPGLVVMGGDNWSRGHKFVSQHCTYVGSFLHLFVVKIVLFKKTNNCLFIMKNVKVEMSFEEHT